MSADYGDAQGRAVRRLGSRNPAAAAAAASGFPTWLARLIMLISSMMREHLGLPKMRPIKID